MTNKQQLIQNQLNAYRQQIKVRDLIGAIFLRSDDDQVFADTLNVVLKELESDFGLFGYINEQGNLQCPSISHHFLHQSKMDAHKNNDNIVLHKSMWGDFWGKSLKQKSIEYSNKLLKVPDGHVKLKNAIAVPILNGKELIGQIVVANHPHLYEKYHIELLESICNHLGPLLNAWLKRRSEILLLKKSHRLLETHIKERTKELFENEQRLKLAGLSAYDLIYEWDVATNKLLWFGNIDKMLGYKAGEISADLNSWLELIHPDDQKKLKNAVAEHRDSLQPIRYEYRIRHKDGDFLYWEDNALPMLDEQRKPYKWIGVCTDVTEKKQAFNALAASEEKYRLMMETANEGIWWFDTEFNTLYVNASMYDLLGYKDSEIVGKNISQFISQDHLSRFQKIFTAVREKCEPSTFEFCFQHKNNKSIWCLFSCSPIKNQNGNIDGALAFLTDITIKKEHEKRLEHIAHYDALTGLPNRLLLSDRLQHAMVQGKRHNNLLALAYVDLDGFKEVNDNHGHNVGDYLLQSIANRMKNCLRKGDTVARLGGDEFVLIITDLKSIHDSYLVISEVLQKVAKPIYFQDLILQVSASIGISFYPDDNFVGSEQLLRQADQAMYQAKLSGKNRYHIFNLQEDKSIRGRQESLAEIEKAIREKQFVLYYQPKINMKSGEIVGCEALIRWIHPDKGIIPPMDFLPIIEDSSLTIQVGDWVIRQVFTQIDQWQKSGINLPVSINVSGYQLQDPNFMYKLTHLLNAYPKIDPHYITLEVLETSALEDINYISDLILECEQLGINFSLDDFGTGYSSLTYLKRLSAKELKIDQSFVRNMLDNPEDLAILEGVLGLSRSFNRQVVAEGVETSEHGLILLRLGCTLAQGFSIAKPMPAEDMFNWYQNWIPESSWSEIRTIEHKDIPLLFAATEHRAWIKELEKVIFHNYHQIPPMDKDACQFSKWLNTIQTQDNKIVKRITKNHQMVHHLACSLLENKKDLSDEKIQLKFNEIHHYKDKLLQDIESLLSQNDKAGELLH